jgi:hypothetical protein
MVLVVHISGYYASGAVNVFYVFYARSILPATTTVKPIYLASLYTSLFGHKFFLSTVIELILFSVSPCGCNHIIGSVGIFLIPRYRWQN